MIKQEEIRDIFTEFGKFIREHNGEFDFDWALKALRSILKPPRHRPRWGVVVNSLEDWLFWAKVEDILWRYGQFEDGDIEVDVKYLPDIDEAIKEIDKVLIRR